MKIIIINGPNLNLLGKREPEIYGSTSFEDYLKELQNEYNGKCEIEYFQSNAEGQILDKLHQIGFTYDGIVLNAGALTHTSIALADAVSGITTPVIEVHISNVHKREVFRHKSYLSSVSIGMMTGFGLHGYSLAINYFIKTWKNK